MVLWMLLAALGHAGDCPEVQASFVPTAEDRVYVGLVDAITAETGAAQVRVLHARGDAAGPTAVIPPPRTCDDLQDLEPGQLLVVVERDGRALRSLGSAVVTPDLTHYPFAALGPGEPLSMEVVSAVLSGQLSDEAYPGLRVFYAPAEGGEIPWPPRPRRRDRDDAPAASAASATLGGWRYGAYSLVTSMIHWSPSCHTGAALLEVWTAEPRPRRIYRLSAPQPQLDICPPAPAVEVRSRPPGSKGRRGKRP